MRFYTNWLASAERTVVDFETPAARFAEEIQAMLVRSTNVQSTEIPRSALAQALTTQPIRYADGLRDTHTRQDFIGLRSGTIELDNGKLVQIIARTKVPETRKQTELAAQAIHEESPFTNYFPVTVVRDDGTLVQERVGKSFLDRANTLDKRFFRDVVDTPQQGLLQRFLGWNRPDHEGFRWFPNHKRFDESPSFKQVFANHPQFGDQLEQAMVERLVWGDQDAHAGNFAVAVRKGNIRVANIDPEMVFSEKLYPAEPLMYKLGSQPVSTSTLNKVDQFLTKFDSIDGREFTTRAFLSSTQHDAMLSRADWFLRHKQFPAAWMFQSR